MSTHLRWDVKGKPLNVPQSFLWKQLCLLYNSVFLSVCWARILVNPENIVHKAPFLQCLRRCLYLTVINSQLSDRLVPACFAVRLCTCCLCSDGAAPRRAPSENKWMSYVCDLLTDEICPLLHFHWNPNKSKMSELHLLSCHPSIHGRVDGDLLLGSQIRHHLSVLAEGTQPVFSVLPSWREENMLSWSLIRPHHLLRTG